MKDTLYNGSQPKRKKEKSNKKLIALIASIIVVVGLVAVIVFQQITINSKTTEEEEARNIQNQLSKLMILPKEEALVSEIKNVNEIKDQAFFSKAENGDKVLIFVQDAKIVIYRDCDNKIVNVGPIVDDRTAETTTNTDQ